MSNLPERGKMDYQTYCRLTTLKGKTADEIIRDIRTVNSLDYDATQARAKAHIKTLLLEAGYDLSQCTFWSILRPKYGRERFSQAELDHITKNFPRELQVLILPGALFGGETKGPGVYGVVRDNFDRTGFTGFLRIVDLNEPKAKVIYMDDLSTDDPETQNWN